MFWLLAFLVLAGHRVRALAAPPAFLKKIFHTAHAISPADHLRCGPRPSAGNRHRNIARWLIRLYFFCFFAQLPVHHISSDIGSVEICFCGSKPVSPKVTHQTGIKKPPARSIDKVNGPLWSSTDLLGRRISDLSQAAADRISQVGSSSHGGSGRLLRTSLWPRDIIVAHSGAVSSYMVTLSFSSILASVILPVLFHYEQRGGSLSDHGPDF